MNKRTKQKTPRSLAFDAIARIEGDRAYLDIVLSHILQRNENVRDHALISELVRGTIRWKKQLEWIVNSFLDKPRNLPKEVHWLLWLGTLQIIHMHTPDFAAVNETVELAKNRFPRWSKLVNGVLRSIIRKKDNIQFPDKDKEPVKYIAVTQSHPEWLVTRWIDQFGFDETMELCQANNKIPPVTVRFNSLKLDKSKFEKMLTEHGFEYTAGTLCSFYRLQKMNVPKFQEWMQLGLITVQDESAGLVSLICDPLPGMTVFDICAAPGGKAAHLAELTKDNCLIIAGEINPSRSGLIKTTAKRLHLNSVHTISADGNHFPGQNADLVLLDAPCSGLGILRKKPDLRWNRSLQDISELNDLQSSLISHAANWVRPGGSLVYSTCTVEYQENEKIVESFLRKHPEFVKADPEMLNIDKQFIAPGNFYRTWPHLHNTDGSFVAKLNKQKD